MKISLAWLKEYIDIDLPVEQVSQILTAIGLEVEGTDEVETIRGGLKDVVIGEVRECSKHPDADKLSLTKVNVGAEEQLQIVCGAPNVAAGQKVLVALVGCKIYTGPDESFTIKRSKIRGVESQGMICAEDELGLGDSHDGIMVLPDDAKIGTPAAEYFKVETDTVFDIGLTPNRSDATSHLGVARDLLAYLKMNEGSQSQLKWPSAELDSPADGIDIKVKIEDGQACPRFSGVVLRNVQVGPSPDWMKQRLESIGVRSINNIVDITNFVLHEYGQPLHAYNLDKIAKDEIRVKFLPAGTPFLSLDEKERKLRAQDLMICDGEDKPMCMAGVFGGIDSGVVDDTTRVYLEAAYFDAKTLRNSSMSHILRTDAAMVFEKGSDPMMTVPALKRAAQLMVEYAGAEIASEITDVISAPIERKQCTVRWARVNRVIGNDIPAETVVKILEALDFEILKRDDQAVLVSVPTCRADVTREVDVIEEILRIYGFNQVEIGHTANYALIPSERASSYAVQDQLSALLTGRGFLEMMGLSLMKTTDLVAVGQEEERLVKINNTSNIELNAMRPDLLLSGLESIKHNLNRRQLRLKLYELGKSYQRQDDDYHEEQGVSLFVSGASTAYWNRDEQSSDFYELKSEVHAVLQRFGIVKYQSSELEDERFAYGMHYHQGPKTIAKFGLLSPKICRKMDVDQEVFAAWIDWKSILRKAAKHSITIEAPSKYPAITRDLALKLRSDVSYGKIEALSRKIAKPHLTDLRLFDVYISDEMKSEGFKSYAISYTFQSAEKTLKDKEIEKTMNKLISTYERELGAEIRK